MVGLDRNDALVRQALREGKLDSAGVEEWLDQQAEMTAFTGVLTTAVV